MKTLKPLLLGVLLGIGVGLVTGAGSLTKYVGNFYGTGTGLTNTIKRAFATNYTVAASDSILFCAGTNQKITLPSAVTALAGKMFTIVAATNNGSVIVTNFNGVQTILGGLSVAVAATNRLTVISDGSVYW